MHTASVPHARSWQVPRSGRYLRRSSAFAALFFLPLVSAHNRPRAPEPVSNIEFWNLFTTMSEPGGSFVSENFVSNLMSFQDVIPMLPRSLTTGPPCRDRS
jgi:hypothetical protein